MEDKQMLSKPLRRQCKKVYLGLVRKPVSPNVFELSFFFNSIPGNYHPYIGKIFSKLARANKLSSLGIYWDGPGKYIKKP